MILLQFYAVISFVCKLAPSYCTAQNVISDSSVDDVFCDNCVIPRNFIDSFISDISMMSTDLRYI